MHLVEAKIPLWKQVPFVYATRVSEMRTISFASICSIVRFTNAVDERAGEHLLQAGVMVRYFDNNLSCQPLNHSVIELRASPPMGEI